MIGWELHAGSCSLPHLTFGVSGMMTGESFFADPPLSRSPSSNSIKIDTSADPCIKGDIFMTDLAAAAFATQTESVTAEMSQNAVTALHCWTLYLESIGTFRDIFLSSFSVSQWLQVILSFAAATRQAWFSMGCSKRRVVGGVHCCLSCVCARLVLYNSCVCACVFCMNLALKIAFTI